eukprot:TRINITY_DN1007_c0_g1_i1.p1 TRINITY_DN1007_c0_g1~~TRINITY_DN1007_c0_g1_i1.p1  ORF type:complete len:408 (+),score=98.13 TRINITY_DN1007_c0_g1_i1:59-1282(+)
MQRAVVVALAILSASSDATLIHHRSMSPHSKASPKGLHVSAAVEGRTVKMVAAAPAASPVAAPASSPMAAGPAGSPQGAPMNFGSPKCPCVGIAGIDGITKATVGNNLTVNFPADLGARCAAWDNGINKAFCMPGQEPGEDNGWCAEPWCYVDPCNCELDEPATKSPEDGGYLPGASYQGKGLWYSYKTCGGVDYWMDAEKKKEHQSMPKECGTDKDDSVWGDERCPCIGFADQKGHTNVSISPGLEMPYPADTGATCRLWDWKRHPECQKKEPPKWCDQAWCYVDPCNCRIPNAPKLSAYLPDAKASGKPIYYSYATCGSVDEFAESNEKACVNLKAPKFCKKNKKCAWNGVECLGKDLVKTCGRGKAPKPAEAPKQTNRELPEVAVLILGLVFIFAVISLMRQAS